jgi:hypothetical protein
MAPHSRLNLPRFRRFAMIVLATLGSAEVAARAVYWRESAQHLLALPVAASALLIPESSAEFEGRLTAPDPVIGYSFVPGEHLIRIRKGALVREFSATIDQTGDRVTAPSNAQTGTGHQIWLLGCSFTWGYLLNDQNTFAWKLQETLPDYRVRNMGRNGLGTIHSYLRLKHAVESRDPQLPAIAVLVHNPFHLARNTISVQALSNFRVHRDRFGWLTYPAVRIEPDRPLQVRMVGIFTPEAMTAPSVSEADQIRLAKAILHETAVLCRHAGIRCAFAVQGGLMQDPIVQAAAREGLVVIDMRVNLEEAFGRAYTYAPLDSHPNERAHKRYAELLKAGLTPLLPDVEPPAPAIRFVWTRGASQVQQAIQLTNPGSAPLRIDLHAKMPEGALQVTANPASVVLPPNSSFAAELLITGKPLPGTYNGYLELRSDILRRVPIRLDVPAK